MKYVFVDESWEDYLYWQKIDKKKVKKINETKEFYLVSDGFTHAHGDSIKSAKKDFHFKLISEKLKKEPITKDTMVSLNHYRAITGACLFGCKDFMNKNNILFTEKNGEIIVEPIKALNLLKLLEKSNAYGLETFKQLMK